MNGKIRPKWFVYFFGGTFDSGNGFGWRPNIYRLICRYYLEDWSPNYTLQRWLSFKQDSEHFFDDIFV